MTTVTEGEWLVDWKLSKKKNIKDLDEVSDHDVAQFKNDWVEETLGQCFVPHRVSRV